MKVTPYDHGIDLVQSPDAGERSKGLHASDLYGSLAKKLQPKRYDKRDKDGNPTKMNGARVNVGTAWEPVIEEAVTKLLMGSRPPEMRSKHQPTCSLRRTKIPKEVLCSECYAGIYYSPDWLFDTEDELILGEFKVTWMSTKGAISDPKFDKYKAQIKLYCYWLGITKARLFVLFINGDWKTFEPVLLAWEMEFTPRELELNYNAHIRHGLKEGLVK